MLFYAFFVTHTHTRTHIHSQRHMRISRLGSRLRQHQDKRTHERHRQDSASWHSQSRPELLVFVAWLGFSMRGCPRHSTALAPLPKLLPQGRTVSSVPRSIICAWRGTGANIKCGTQSVCHKCDKQWQWQWQQQR